MAGRTHQRDLRAAPYNEIHVADKSVVVINADKRLVPALLFVQKGWEGSAQPVMAAWQPTSEVA
jgi:hypothetical protein